MDQPFILLKFQRKLKNNLISVLRKRILAALASFQGNIVYEIGHSLNFVDEKVARAALPSSINYCIVRKLMCVSYTWSDLAKNRK